MKRDRLIFLQNLLKEADRRLEKNINLVLQKAGYYLNIITDGRYDACMQKMTKRTNDSLYIDQLLEADHPVSRGHLNRFILRCD